ncbi:hypothetical protein [Sphingomonas sp. BK580]|uniref:hypothetical protein n=1 Tax=Sphingomonas sp. BK580 TaxID=2586972 RepID=UPI0016079F45|nr:hypothetical protein [Sphingomonas sp. BK580]MBB3693059.1 hypothetical protein [Sphingomonas sp. BK580]
MSVCRAVVVACWVALGSIAAAGPAGAQERSAVRPGFTLPRGAAPILLLRPRIIVGAQSTAGLFQANADWTAQAREQIEAALAAAQRTLGNEVVRAPEAIGADTRLIADYQALFAVVARSVIDDQFFKRNRLPTKRRAGQFDWTLGPDVARIARGQGCGYALFVDTEDAYGSTGRKIFQVLAAVTVGVGVRSGEHTGYAGLVDLRTGDLVWLNADRQMGGDVRTPEGAAKRVAELLDGFPGRAEVPVTSVAAPKAR